MSNRLAHSSSAYLRSASHQPIHWYEFGEEAFNKAKELDLPVLLDIGAVWCHWCHVIDRESYDDPEIAQLINENYIAVKVDRDQRPDVDSRYQQVIASMTGQGGWPLTGFLTYDGRVIYGGTYFPPEMMKNLLVRIKEIYATKKDEIFKSDELLTNERVHEVKTSTARHDAKNPPLTKDFYENIILSLRNSFDNGFGGFGTQPKFPHFSALELLLTYNFHQNDETNRNILQKTLEEMAKGGIYDQVAGGFHRYSVDRMWHVPHFEKMSYDNAEALKIYAQAYRLTQNPLFKETALGIIQWVNNQLSDQVDGGFYASQDADIDLNDDGDHFTWTLDEAKETLTPEEFEFIVRYYDLTSQGDMHDRPGRNVLWVRNTMEQVANLQGISVNEAKDILTRSKAKMLANRNIRPIPFIDTTLYTNWNSMMVSGYLEASELLDLAEARSFALKTLRRFIEELYEPGYKVYHCQGVDGFLEDYAHFAMANAKAYQVTGETEYLQNAQDVIQLVLNHFQDHEHGGFFDTYQNPEALGLLKFPHKPAEDSPYSSANAVILQTMNQLHLITGNTSYQAKVDETLRVFQKTHERHGMFVGALGIAAYHHLNPPLKIELVGDSGDLKQQAHGQFYPGKVLVFNQEEKLEKPEARLCIGHRCFHPIPEGGQLSTLLETVESNR